MDPQTLTLIVGQLVILITAIGGLIKIWGDVRGIHEIVNSKHTAMQEEINRLRELVTTSRATTQPVPNKIVQAGKEAITDTNQLNS